jgi:hypothetical protein
MVCRDLHFELKKTWGIEVLGSEQLQGRAPEIYLALLESVDFINQRNSEGGKQSRIQLNFR